MGGASSPGNTVNDPPPYKSHSNPCAMQMLFASEREQKCPKKKKANLKQMMMIPITTKPSEDDLQHGSSPCSTRSLTDT